MAADIDNHEPPIAALAGLRDELAALAERVAALEKIAGGPARAVSAPPPPLAPSGNAGSSADLAPEAVAVITAVLAAHLGVKPHLRQVSLVRSGAWVHTGRVTIQASHALAVPHD